MVAHRKPALLAALVAVAVAATAMPAAATPPVRERVDLATDAELRVDGSADYEALGTAVDAAGDVNGDGRPDIIVGGQYPGVAYVIFGGTRGIADAGAVGSHGFKIEVSDDYASTHVSGAGDVNGDGLADVIVSHMNGSANGREYSGVAYVVFGKATTATVDVEALGNHGFRIEGSHRWDRLGWRVDSAGDVNLDGLADVVVSAPWTEGGRGSVYVVFGKASTDRVDLAALGARGYAIRGGGDLVGLGLANAGDFNGDGRPDVLIGQSSYGFNAPTYIVFGKRTTDPVDLTLLGSSGVAIRHPQQTDSNGRYLAGAGDVNGDRIDDVLLGGGPSHVVFGRRSSDPIELAALGNGGFEIGGGVDGTGAYAPVAGPGDVDGDGLADVMVATPGADGTRFASVGRTYVVLGRTSTAPVRLDSLGGRGFEIHGASTYDHAGSAISGAGDVDGDGHPDLVVGAAAADNNERQGSGSVYLVRGGRCCRRALRPPGEPTVSAPVTEEAHMRVAGQGVGGAMDAAGDVNGDGLGDFVATAVGPRPLGDPPASAYVIFGTRAKTNIELPALGSHGFRIDVTGDDHVASVTGVGDMNRDGLADVIVGVSKNYRVPGRESAFVVFGKRTGEPVRVDSLGTGGFEIAGPDTGYNRGIAVAGLGDVNGDRWPDVAVSVASETDDYRATGVYVVFGKGSTGRVDLTALGSGGYRITAGSTLDGWASAVRAAGDVNGDGRADLIVPGYPGDDNPFYSGVTSVVFGKSSTDPIDVRALGSGGFAIEGPPLDDDPEVSIDGAGDVNGDRLDDVVLTYPYATNFLRDGSGWSYVVFGKRASDRVRLAALGSSGFRISGNPLQLIPFAAAGAGDFNRDGRSDVVLGYSGACVVLGRKSSATVDLAALGRRGICLHGPEGSGERRSVAGVGDVNGDRYADVAVGARYEGGYEGPYRYPGAIYIVPGRKLR